MKMSSQPPAAVVLVLLLSSGIVAAGSNVEWTFPGTGVAKLYSFNDDFVVEDSHPEPFVTGSWPVPFHYSLLELMSEESVDTRVHTSKFAGHAVTLGTGLGSGAGKGTGATSQSAEKVDKTSIRGAAAAKSKQPQLSHSWFGWMRFSLSFAFVVKALCMMCNICYQASPLPLITAFNAKGDTGSADLAPFIAVAYGGWQWCFYGLFAYIVTNKSGFLVLVWSNVVGATLGLYYVYAFTQNCKNAAMLNRSIKYYYVLAGIVATQVVAIMSLQDVRALFFCGLISSAWSTIASLSLISTVPTVYERRSCASLPVPLLFMGEISAVLWVLCGVMLWDPWITFPNCFSFFVCTFALYLCWRYPADGPEAEPILDVDVLKASMAKEVLKEVETDEASCNPIGGRASPLQRALGFVAGSSASAEKESFHDPLASARLYGGTGGTGDGF